MLKFLVIINKNKKYYMNVVNTESPSTIDNYQLINTFILNNCDNVSSSNFISSKQNPLEYIRGDFDLSRLIINADNLRYRYKDFQITTVYYDKNNKPVLYKSIDRSGNIRIHDISEFEYTKNGSILGDNIDKLPNFVENKPVEDAYEFLKNNINEKNLAELPVGLAKQYLILVKGFKEGFHTITKVNNGIEYDVHEHLLFNGSITFKLVEYVAKDKKAFMTKQDKISNPYPKERTVGFLSSPIILFGSKRLLIKHCKMNVCSEFEYFNTKATKVCIPLCDEMLPLYDKFVKSKDVLYSWYLNYSNNLSSDIYNNVLPNELFKLPAVFFRTMRNLPASYKKSYKLQQENDSVETWMHTVALLICWQFFQTELKRKMKPLIDSYEEIYAEALRNIVDDIGPKDTLTVMEWTKENLKVALKKLLDDKDISIDEYSCLFSFYQNEFDLPEELRIFSEEAIESYGGVEKLKSDYENQGVLKKQYILDLLDKLDRVEKDNKADSNLKDIKYRKIELESRN